MAKKKTSKKKVAGKTKKSPSDSVEKADNSSSKAGKKSSKKTSKPQLAAPSPQEMEKLLFEHLIGLLILDERSKIVYANEPAGRLLGKEPQKLIGVKVTKLKSFSEATDQLLWSGKTCRLMVENTAERRLAKAKIELKKSLYDLEKSQDELSTARRRAEDADERAQEMEGFLEQLETQQSELEGRLEHLKEQARKAQAEWEETEAGLFKRVARLESSLNEKTQELEEGHRQKVETEMALEAARRECVILTHEVAQLQDSSSSQDSILAQKVGTLQSLIMQADAKEAGFLRKVAELEAALKESRDEATIAKYDWNEALEKLEATRLKLENAEGRVKDAADELFKAWEVAEAAQKKAQEADELREKAEKRTAELEQIFEKITPEEDDTIMGFL